MNFLELADYVVVGLAMLLGVSVGRRMKPRVQVMSRPKAECTCGHGFGQHESGKKCQADVERPNVWDNYGSPVEWTYVKCQCALYDGPDPELVKMLGA